MQSLKERHKSLSSHMNCLQNKLLSEISMIRQCRIVGNERCLQGGQLG